MTGFYRPLLIPLSLNENLVWLRKMWHSAPQEKSERPRPLCLNDSRAPSTDKPNVEHVISFDRHFYLKKHKEEINTQFDQFMLYNQRLLTAHWGGGGGHSLRAIPCQDICRITQIPWHCNSDTIDDTASHTSDKKSYCVSDKLIPSVYACVLKMRNRFWVQNASHSPWATSSFLRRPFSCSIFIFISDYLGTARYQFKKKRNAGLLTEMFRACKCTVIISPSSIHFRLRFFFLPALQIFARQSLPLCCYCEC